MSDKEYKIVLLGGGAVGKSSLAIRFVKNQFVSDYNPTIEDSYRKSVLIDETVAVVDVLDTAGQEEYSAMRSEWIRYGDGFIIMYSLTSKISFETLEKEINPLLTRFDVADIDEYDSSFDTSPLPLTIFANKLDLESERQVSVQEGKNMAIKLKANFIEGSAKTCVNVYEAFYNVVRGIRIHREKKDVNSTPNTDTKKEPSTEPLGELTSPRAKKKNVCTLF